MPEPLAAGDAVHLAGVQCQVEVIDDVDGFGTALAAAVVDGDVAQFQRGGVVRGLDDGVGAGLQATPSRRHPVVAVRSGFRSFVIGPLSLQSESSKLQPPDRQAPAQSAA